MLFIDVNDRASVGAEVPRRNEYKTAERLRDDYWLYVAYNCAATPDLYTIQDPVQLGFKPVVTIEHYSVGSKVIVQTALDVTP